MARRLYASMAERLLANSAVSVNRGLDGEPCWEWLGPLHYKGYGLVTSRVPGGQPRPEYTHRKAAEELGGFELPPDAPKNPVSHRCDFRPCINPAHLRPATAKENMEDMHRKGRGSGVKGVTPYLAEQEAVRKRKEAQELADRLAVADALLAGRITADEAWEQHHAAPVCLAEAPRDTCPGWWREQVTLELEEILFPEAPWGNRS